MQFRYTYLKYTAGLAFMVLLLSACFKKYDEIDTLNMNMFDREYAGDAWFNVDSVYYFVTPSGSSQARFEISIRKDRLPSLRPSSIAVEFSTAGVDPFIIEFPLTGGGAYERIIDLPFTGSGEYCITLGVYVSSDSSVINRFEGCGTL